MDLVIRKEVKADIQFISDITRGAFQDNPHRNNAEHLIINALREDGALTVSLVAEVHGQVIGHVAFSPVMISDGTQGWYGLGPMAVLPAFHGQGVGSALARNGLEEIRAMGAKGCVVLGDPDFFGRFGFVVNPNLVFEDAPLEHCLSLLLNGDWPRGKVIYHEAFLGYN